jgi:DtxR family Mn-dependent transcriptional regulator
VKEIAERMTVSRPSVVHALKELQYRGLIHQERYGYVHMTEEGLNTASSILNKHNLLKEFLVFLGVSESVAEQDACKMEHLLSKESLRAIETFLRERK